MFSEPVNREVTSKDVKYAIERAFTANVANGYARDLLRATSSARRRSRAPTRRSRASRRRTTRRSSSSSRRAPARRSPARWRCRSRSRCRRSTRRSTTRRTRRPTARATPSTPGPYMVESDADGKATGYVAGQEIHLVRNPRLRAGRRLPPRVPGRDRLPRRATRTPPSPRAASSTGESLALGRASSRRRASSSGCCESNKTELSAVPGGGWRFISMDTSRPPFDDINVRKAVIAGFNRDAARQQRGGEALGPIAQHYIPPGMAGFEESNGARGLGRRAWTGWRIPRATAPCRPSTSRRPAWRSGKYEGNEKLLIVGDNAEPDKSIAQITEQQLNEMGFKTKLRLVTRDTMLTKFCNVPELRGQRLPVRRLAAGLRGSADDARPDVQRREHPPDGELQLARARRARGQQGDRRREARDRPGRARAGVGRRQPAESSPRRPAIPYMWDYQTVVASPNVRGVQNGY